MAKQKTEGVGQIASLRTHMFDQIDRLNDPSCDLEKELKKADAIVRVGNVIVNSVKAEIDFARVLHDANKGKQKSSTTKRLTNG
jgi:hypothetical protein